MLPALWIILILAFGNLVLVRAGNRQCGKKGCNSSLTSDHSLHQKILDQVNSEGENARTSQKQLTSCYLEGIYTAYIVSPADSLPVCPFGSSLAIYTADDQSIFSNISDNCNPSLPLLFQAYQGFNCGFNLILYQSNVQSFDFVNIGVSPPNGIAVCAVVPVDIATLTTPSTLSEFTTTTLSVTNTESITDLLIDETTTTFTANIFITVSVTIPTYITPETLTETSTTLTTETEVEVISSTTTEAYSVTNTIAITTSLSLGITITSFSTTLATDIVSNTITTTSITVTTETTSTTDVILDVLTESLEVTMTSITQTSTTVLTSTTTTTTSNTPSLTTTSVTTTSSVTATSTFIITDTTLSLETLSQTSTSTLYFSTSTTTSTTTTRSETTSTTSITIQTILNTATFTSTTRTTSTLLTTTPSTTLTILVTIVTESVTSTTKFTSTTLIPQTTTSTITTFNSLKNAEVVYRQAKKAQIATCAFKYRGIVMVTDAYYAPEASSICNSLGPGYRLLDITDEIVLKAARDVMVDCGLYYYVSIRSFFGLGSDNNLNNCLSYYDDGVQSDVFFVSNSILAPTNLCETTDPAYANYILCRSIPTEAQTSSYGTVFTSTSYLYTDIAEETITESYFDTTTETYTSFTTTSTSSILLSVIQTTSYNFDIIYQ